VKALVTLSLDFPFQGAPVMQASRRPPDVRSFWQTDRTKEAESTRGFFETNSQSGGIRLTTDAVFFMP
jgi:hypothetical protein